MKRTILPILLMAILLTGGVAHGLRTDRWSSLSEEQIAEAGEKLKQFPLRVGNWEDIAGRKIDTAERTETNVARNYVNRINGNSVSVLLNCGRARSVSQFHTPDQCYPDHGFTVAGRTRTAKVTLHDNTECRFNVSDFKKGEGSTAQYVRVFWAWSGDGNWTVNEQPWLTLARYRVLHKLYVTHGVATPDEPIDEGPGMDFIRDVVPIYSEVVFPR